MTAAHLHIEGVTVHIGPVAVLRDVTIEVAAGSRHAIIGPNGAGKSTLLAAIAGTRRTAAGRIAIDGRDITGWPAHRVARLGVARVWARPAICPHLTALENIELGIRGVRCRGRRREQAAGLLRDADLTEQAITIAGVLSYGQQRRLELAIALASQPRILLLDEPSAGLTTRATTRLVDQLRALAPDVTILFIEHNRDVVDTLANLVTTLDQGHVVEYQQMACRPSVMVRTRPTPAAPRDGPAPPTTRRDGHSTTETALRIRNLSAAIHGTTILEHVALDLHPGEILRISGANGAGKTTFLHAIAGLTPTGPQTVITLHGRPIAALTAAQRARLGLALIPQDGCSFSTLTIAENLYLGRRLGTAAGEPLGELFDALRLRPRLNDRAGGLSGGEQQLVVLAQALASRPTVLLLDEPFTRLAPSLAEDVRRIVIQLAKHGTAILLVDHTTPVGGGTTHTAIITKQDLESAASLVYPQPV